MKYRAIWSLMVSRIQESGAIDVPMSYDENRRLEAQDRFWNESVQAERDPYVSHNHEYKLWVQKRNRRIA